MICQYERYFGHSDIYDPMCEQNNGTMQSIIAFVHSRQMTTFEDLVHGIRT
jgi:hypothetical protein